MDVCRLISVVFLFLYAVAVQAGPFPVSPGVGIAGCDGAGAPEEPRPPESRRCGGSGSGEEPSEPPGN